MKVIFISDAHLNTRDSRGYQNLMAFLEGFKGRENGKGRVFPEGGNGGNGNGNAVEIDDLYVLGDLFDFWFSKGADIYPEFGDIIDRLAELQRRGVRIHLCEGNHDFFLADYFATELGMEVIAGWAALDLDGRRVLISHGDTVDEGNTKYLLLRRFLRSRFFYKLQRALPTPFLWKAARVSSNLGKESAVESAKVLTGKMRAFSLRKFRDGFDAVVLGHCHQHLLEESVINADKKTFVILGDWVNQYSYLCYEDGNFTLANFQPQRSVVKG